MAVVIHQFKITGPQMSLTFVAPVGTTNIGRHTDNDLVFVHPLVSRRHAKLETTEESCQITDLGSTHGSLVNQEQLAPQSPYTLKSGDAIDIGAFHMEYEQIRQPDPVTGPEPEADRVDETAAPAAAAASPTPEKPRAAAKSSASAVSSTSEYTPVSRPFSSYTAKPEPEAEQNGEFVLPPGLSMNRSSYQQFLPDIYYEGSNPFMPRFLALLESILAPIEWNINHFDLFLDPMTAPDAFLPWLANWYEIIFDESWSEESRRTLLKEAYQIYNRRGTAWALGRILEIYMGVDVEIDDQDPNLEQFTFSVRFPLREIKINRSMVEQIINANKPAHTTYTLMFKG